VVLHTIIFFKGDVTTLQQQQQKKNIKNPWRTKLHLSLLEFLLAKCSDHNSDIIKEDKGARSDGGPME